MSTTLIGAGAAPAGGTATRNFFPSDVTSNTPSAPPGIIGKGSGVRNSGKHLRLALEPREPLRIGREPIGLESPNAASVPNRLTVFAMV